MQSTRGKKSTLLEEDRQSTRGRKSVYHRKTGSLPEVERAVNQLKKEQCTGGRSQSARGRKSSLEEEDRHSTGGRQAVY